MSKKKHGNVSFPVEIYLGELQFSTGRIFLGEEKCEVLSENKELQRDTKYILCTETTKQMRYWEVVISNPVEGNGSNSYRYEAKIKKRSCFNR